MAQFQSDIERDIAAGIFRYLVTPSGTKIAQGTLDLVSFAEAQADDVKSVLSILSDRPEARILRRLANPERYEIFHDVLAHPILDWRRGYLLRKEAEERRSAEAEKQRRRFRWILQAIVAFLVITGVTVYAYQRIREARRIETVHRGQAQAEAIAAQKRAEASRADAEAARADAMGERSEARSLRSKAEALALQAQAANQQARYLSYQLTLAAEEKDKKYRDALQQIDSLKQQLSISEEQRKQLEAERSQSSKTQLPALATSGRSTLAPKVSQTSANPTERVRRDTSAPGSSHLFATDNQPVVPTATARPPKPEPAIGHGEETESSNSARRLKSTFNLTRVQVVNLLETLDDVDRGSQPKWMAVTHLRQTLQEIDFFKILGAYPSDIAAQSFSRTGKLLAFGHLDGFVDVVNLESGNWLPYTHDRYPVFNTGSQPILDLQFADDDERNLFVLRADGMLSVWNVETGRALGQWNKFFPMPPSWVSFSDNAKYLAACYGILQTGSLWIWVVNTGDQLSRKYWMRDPSAW